LKYPIPQGSYFSFLWHACYPSSFGDNGANTSFQESSVVSSRLKQLESLGGCPVFHVESEGVGAGVADVDPDADERYVNSSLGAGVFAG
jgi:hypothetical protein